MKHSGEGFPLPRWCQPPPPPRPRYRLDDVPARSEAWCSAVDARLAKGRDKANSKRRAKP